MKTNSTLVFIFMLALLMQSCKEKSQKKATSTLKEISKSEEIPSKSTPIPVAFKSLLKPNEKLQLGKIYKDTVSYIEFNDNYDDFYFIVKKNRDTINLIYNQEPTKFIRGKAIEIQWKIDSLWPAGTPGLLHFKEYLISAKSIKPLQLTDKKIKILWRENRYDKELDTEINTIVLNQDYINTISEPEKAALAYASFKIGNECQWDEKPNESRSNLRCKIPWALGLRYQCSFEQLDFLKHWFRNDKKVLNELKKCPKKPDGATIQSTFDEIELEVVDTTIMVFFKASGINTRENESWKWTEKQVFEFNKNELIVKEKEISEKERSTIEMSKN